MYKFFLISVILTASLSLSFSTNNSNCEEKKDLYDLTLKKNDPDVVKFAEDGWEKLVAKGRTRGATNRGSFSVECARVQIIEIERRYTILVIYVIDGPGKMLFCVIFVMTTQTEPLSISCYLERFTDIYDPAEREQRNMYSLFYNNKLFCPQD
ncbi:uncharacterized protein LOC123271230 [Cotesia glomerata]|uniref:uncharacterized protein LOC123271230 n=1 Tax=Cotesia glomerata TaxID=32391 RepID=UPI001D002EC2|nr:uncharacterized protein LOC123271230 [Cotesia glomerata]